MVFYCFDVCDGANLCFGQSVLSQPDFGQRLRKNLVLNLYLTLILAFDNLLTMRYLVLVLSLFAAKGSLAAVYKCIHPDGKTAYQGKPCPPGQKTVEINFKTGEAVDKKNELVKRELEFERRKLEELAVAEKEAKLQKLLSDAKTETEKNMELIKSNPKRFTVYAIPPYDPDNLNALVGKFKSRLPEIEAFRRKAALKALDSGNCQRVEASELNIKSTDTDLVLLVNCSSGQGIYYSEKDLK